MWGHQVWCHSSHPDVITIGPVNKCRWSHQIKIKMFESKDVFVFVRLSNHHGAQMWLHQRVWLCVPVMVGLCPLSAAAQGQLAIFGNDDQSSYRWPWQPGASGEFLLNFPAVPDYRWWCHSLHILPGHLTEMTLDHNCTVKADISVGFIRKASWHSRWHLKMKM